MKAPRSSSLVYRVSTVVNAGFAQLGEQGLGDFVVGVGDDFAGRLIDDVLGDDATDDESSGTAICLRPAVPMSRNMFGGDPLVLGNNDLPSGAMKSKRATSPRRRSATSVNSTFPCSSRKVSNSKNSARISRRHADRLEQRRDRHFATTVNRKTGIFRIEFEVQPGTAIGNHAGENSSLPGAVGLAAVMLEEHPANGATGKR